MTGGKKKTYLIILGVCLTGLIVDRFLLSDSVTTPAPASGMAVDVPAGTEPTTGPEEKNAEIPELPFPFEVNKFSENVEKFDPFKLPLKASKDGSKSDKTDQPSINTRDLLGSDRLTTEEFKTQYRISAIVSHGDTYIVVLDDQWLRIGDLVGGCRLSKVSGRQAVFECVDGEATLKFE